VIGKHSVVAAYSQKLDRPLTPMFALAGKDGKTVMQGLVVVRADDPAKTVADLKNYRVIFGPSDCDEKHSAALTLLRAAGWELPAGKLETCEACSDGALKIIDLGPKARSATVISSYAAPLLEGCGTIQKGDLRVVGKTADVPFVEMFLSATLDAATRRRIETAVGQMPENPELLVALETHRGFVPLDQKKSRTRP
jgi:ABC-type phosphate/phosphonate transport system substrate-binding protein